MQRLPPYGHLHCVITANSWGDNAHIQLSSYTQACRYARKSTDLCTQREVCSFLTRGWRGGNLLFTLSFSLKSFVWGQRWMQEFVLRTEMYHSVLIQPLYTLLYNVHISTNTNSPSCVCTETKTDRHRHSARHASQQEVRKLTVFCAGGGEIFAVQVAVQTETKVRRACTFWFA